MPYHRLIQLIAPSAALLMVAQIFIALIFVAQICGADPPSGDATENASGIASQIAPDLHRSPVDLVIDPSGKWLISANETSNSISLVRLDDGQIIDEVSVGSHPTDVVFTPDGKQILVSNAWSGDVSVLTIANEKLRKTDSIDVGFEPTGIAVSPSGDRAFVGLVASGQIAEIDLRKHSLVRRVDVGLWPRYLTFSNDGKRIAVGCSGESQVAVVDVNSGEVLYKEPLANGINLGHMLTSKDGKYAYFTWMVYRTNPINVSNLKRGWILASRIGRVRLDGPEYREAISLDVPGEAVADPHGIVISDDEKRMVASSSGTHELLVYRLPDAPFVATGGPGDLIDRGLQHDRDRFDRVDVGGRPMGMQMIDNRTVCVANYLRDSIQFVDIESKKVVKEIKLGSPDKITLARKGMQIFYDGQRSMDQWSSCQ